MSSSNDNVNLKLFEREILQAPRTSYNVQLKLYDILIPFLAAVIIIVNLVIVFSSGLILKKRQQPRSTYIFLGNVALADMMTGVATLFGQYYPREDRSEIVCSVQIGLIISPTLASVYSIALIALDRYLYILYGLKYQRYLSSKRARLMSIGTWILGGIIGFLPVMGVRNGLNRGVELCWLILLEPNELLLSTVTIGILPLIVVIILYGIILRRALGKISEMRESTTISATVSSNSKPLQLRYFRGGGDMTRTINKNAMLNVSDLSNRIHINVEEEGPARKNVISRIFRRKNSANISSVYSPSRWKAIKIVSLTTGCFFITWFPYFIACALYAMCDQNQSHYNCNTLRVAIASPLAILGLSNSLLNPIIYAWWHNGFRESVKNMYNRLWQQRVKSKFNSVCKNNNKSSRTEFTNTTSTQSSETGTKV